MIYNYLRIYMLNYFTLYISPWNRAYYLLSMAFLSKQRM